MVRTTPQAFSQVDLMSRTGRPARPDGLILGTFRHAAIYSGASILGRMISFFMLPFYAHILRGIGYGVIGMIDASLTLLSSLFAYSFTGALVRIYHEEQDPQLKPLVVSTGTMLVAMIVVPIALVGAAFSKPASGLLLGSTEFWPLICLALGQLLM